MFGSKPHPTEKTYVDLNSNKLEFTSAISRGQILALLLSRRDFNASINMQDGKEKNVLTLLKPCNSKNFFYFTYIHSKQFVLDKSNVYQLSHFLSFFFPTHIKLRIEKIIKWKDIHLIYSIIMVVALPLKW